MGKMVLDVVERAAKARTRARLREQVGDRLAIAPVPEAIEHQPKVRSAGEEIADLAHEVGTVVLVDRHVLDIGQVRFASRRQ